MFANQKTLGNDGPAGITDPTLDIGVDTQYQWIGEEHAVTLRAAYIWEKKKNNVENFGAPGTVNASDELNDLSLSASYIWDRKISFTASRFMTWGTADAKPLYQLCQRLAELLFLEFRSGLSTLHERRPRHLALV